MAYEIYKLHAEGAVDDEWKIDNMMTGPEFCQVAGRQMYEYHAHNLNYPCDESFWSTVCHPKIGVEIIGREDTQCTGGSL